MAALAGCGVNGVQAAPDAVGSAVRVAGAVHGGQQPVVGATVTLMVPNTSQYGGAASVLATAVTGAGGSFVLPGYQCPANNGLVYLLASGGDSGSGANGALVEAAVLGPCNLLTPATFVNVSEVTTVAAAYVLAPFAGVSAGGTGIGAPLSNAQGLANAYGAATQLVSLQSGYALGATATAGVIAPQAEMNTLANVLASCVNSTGSTATTAACGMLFAAATPAGGVAPVDTFQAALDIALNPGANAAALYKLAAASAPFQPTLGTAPADFALALQFNGAPIAGSYGTQGVAIDGLGNAWIATGSVASNAGSTHALTEISPAGVYGAAAGGFGSATLTAPEGVAIDAANNVYVTDVLNNNVYRFAANGSLTSSFTGTSASGPLGIALDTDATFWIANTAAKNVTHLSASGVDVSGSPYTTSAVGTVMVLNAAGTWSDEYGTGNGYLANYSRSAGKEVSRAVSGNAAGLALDSAGNVWYGSDASGGGSLNRLSGAGNSNLSPVPVAAPLEPQEMFIDGLNHVWVSAYNRTTESAPGVLLEYNSAGVLLTPAGGLTANGTMESAPGFPGGLVGDGSGNLWLTGETVNNSGAIQANAFVTELIGIAAPVVTPIAVAAKNGTLGVRP